MNQYDSQLIREGLKKAGLKELENPVRELYGICRKFSNGVNSRTADCYIINTCTVTTNADRQSRYLIRKAKRDNPLAKIIVTGCYAHSNAADIRKIKGVDLIVARHYYLPLKIRRVRLRFVANNGGRRLSRRGRQNYRSPLREIERILAYSAESGSFADSHSGIKEFQGHTRAFVKVQDGCDNFCSFCKVPYARGRSRSRSFDSIIQETRRLSDNGYKEIVLTGICLGDFGRGTNSHKSNTNSHEFNKNIRDDSRAIRADFRRRRTSLRLACSLIDLISEIENIGGILRVRLSSIEAKDVTDKLIAKMKSSAKLCPHLHIPFQSGDNKILKLMNRRDTRESYLKLVNKLKKNIKDITISCDIMIGFPGEGRKEFINTLDFLKKVKPARVHIFPFQARDLTPLENVTNNITATEMKRRFNVIKALTDDLALQFKKRFLNRSLDVLFEDKKDGFWRGYSSNYLLTFVKSRDNLNISNKIIKVKIKGVEFSRLIGGRR